jgi:hypothetical protein
MLLLAQVKRWFASRVACITALLAKMKSSSAGSV